MMIASHYSLFLYAYFFSLLLVHFHKLIKKMVFGDFFKKNNFSKNLNRKVLRRDETLYNLNP